MTYDTEDGDRGLRMGPRQHKQKERSRVRPRFPRSPPEAWYTSTATMSHSSREAKASGRSRLHRQGAREGGGARLSYRHHPRPEKLRHAQRRPQHRYQSIGVTTNRRTARNPTPRSTPQKPVNICFLLFSSILRRNGKLNLKRFSTALYRNTESGSIPSNLSP